MIDFTAWLDSHEEKLVKLEEELAKLEIKINDLSKFVMESKKFEKYIWGSIIFFYAYIGFHVGIWLFNFIG